MVAASSFCCNWGCPSGEFLKFCNGSREKSVGRVVFSVREDKYLTAGKLSVDVEGKDGGNEGQGQDEDDDGVTKKVEERREHPVSSTFESTVKNFSVYAMKIGVCLIEKGVGKALIASSTDRSD